AVVPAAPAPTVMHRPRDPGLIAFISLSSIEVESDDVRGPVSGDLSVAVGGGDVAIDGEIDADRADADLFGRRYEVDQASAYFDGSNDPLIDVELIHKFPDLTLRVQVGGRASKPTLALTSEPAIYSEDQLFGF